MNIFRNIGKTRWRVTLSLLVTALIPLVASLWFGQNAVSRIRSIAFQPEFSEYLEKSLEVYADLAKLYKQSFRFQSDILAQSE